MSIRLFIGNWPFSAGEADLRRLLEQHGKVASVKIVLDRETGESRGFGFADYVYKADADKAIEALNGSMQGGRKIIVNEAKPLPQKR